MQVNATSAASATATDNTATSSGIAKQTLGQDEFLKLLTVQLASQDPMKPMEDTAFISQMASFTSLEQMKNLNTAFAGFATEQRAQTAPGYLGKQVTVTDKELGPVSGVVSAVHMQGGKVSLTVGGKAYSIDSVTAVSLPTAAAAPTAPETPAGGSATPTAPASPTQG